MAVLNYEGYRQKNGVDILKVFCKPTKSFPQGKNYFYVPIELEKYIQEYPWYLIKQGTSVYVGTHDNNTVEYLHILSKAIECGYPPMFDVNHKNLVEIDNVFENLEDIPHDLNQVCKMKQGYSHICHGRFNYFQANIRVNGKLIYSSPIHNEFDACIEQRALELTSRNYVFDILSYKRSRLDLLDDVRTGRISEEDARYILLKELARNVWYIARYNLFDECRKYNIQVSPYRLNDLGYLVDLNGNRLNPYKKS